MLNEWVSPLLALMDAGVAPSARPVNTALPFRSCPKRSRCFFDRKGVGQRFSVDEVAGRGLDHLVFLADSRGRCSGRRPPCRPIRFRRRPKLVGIDETSAFAGVLRHLYDSGIGFAQVGHIVVVLSCRHWRGVLVDGGDALDDQFAEFGSREVLAQLGGIRESQGGHTRNGGQAIEVPSM